MKIGGNSILCHQFHIYKRTRIFFLVRLNLNAVPIGEIVSID